MVEKYRQIQDDLRVPAKTLRGLIPDIYSGFADMHRHTMKDGSLDSKTKELIALAISIVKRCDGCIVSHAKGAARNRATREEVAEAIGVAIMMDGATATVYGPRAFEAYEEFSSN